MLFIRYIYKTWIKIKATNSKIAHLLFKIQGTCAVLEFVALIVSVLTIIWRMFAQCSVIVSV